MSLRELSKLKYNAKYEIFSYIEFYNCDNQIKEGVITGIFYRIENKEYEYFVTIKSGYVWNIKENNIKNIKKIEE